MLTGALSVLSLCVVGFIVKKIVEYSGDALAPKDFLPNISNQNQPPAEPSSFFFQRGGTINDASGLNRSAIYGTVAVKKEDDIKAALRFAREHHLKVSIAGTRHSMGGHSFSTNAVVLDMRVFSKMSVNPEKHVLTVQSGAIWQEVQAFLHPYNLAVKSMQSIAVISVGGTISANAHGMDHIHGSVARTIISLRLMGWDGTVKKISREQEGKLFSAVIGGYGLFGVILDAEIEVTDNVWLNEDRRVIDHRDFPALFQKELQADATCCLLFARLSTAPTSFLKEMIVYAYNKIEPPSTPIPALMTETAVGFSRLMFNLGKTNRLGQAIKWWAEKNILPHFYHFPNSRNQVMYRPLALIRNRLPNETDVLQEYYVPHDKLINFIDGLRLVLKAGQIVVRNVEIRIIHPSGVMLESAQGKRFAVVLYINQKATTAACETVAEVDRQLINLAQSLDGSFYLTYRLNATQSQVERSYPQLIKFLALKKEVDPHTMFTNQFFEKYGGTVND